MSQEAEVKAEIPVSDTGIVRDSGRVQENGSGDNSVSPPDSLTFTTPEGQKTLTTSKNSTDSSGNMPDLNGSNPCETVGDNLPDSATTDSSVKESDANSHSDMPETNTQAASAASPAGDGFAAVSSAEDDTKGDECSNEADDGWLDILGSGQLRKKVLSAGKENCRPPQGSIVTVKVAGYLEDGTCIQDSTETFILGDGDVIPALDMTVALMNTNESTEVKTEPRFAYGVKGRSPDIPEDASLTFQLELLDVQPGPNIEKLSVEERLEFGEKKRERGNELFGREDYSGAINSYSKAVQFVDKSGGLTGHTTVLQQLLDCKIKCYNNMAASQLKVGAPEAAIRSCEEVLQTQPDNIKALYRLGKAYSSKGQTQKAMVPLKRALKLDPESKLLHRELAWLTKQQKREVETEKSMYKRMMGTMADAGAKSRNKKSGNNVLKWTLLAGGLGVAALSVGLAYYRFGH